MDLDTGVQGVKALDYDKYIFRLSNPNFSFDEETGIISVAVPENTRYMECEMTVTYRYGKLAFSQYDMSVTIPLVWTNLSTAKLKEYYTASVRVGNDTDGYETVWNLRVLKNQKYDLPTEEEIRELIGWNDAKYEASTGYQGQATEGLTLIEDTVYDYKVNYKTYSLTVDGIQNADGSTRSEIYTAKYGEAFDFSDLAATGTEIPGTYTKFSGVSTAATVTVNGKDEVIDLTRKINTKFAEALLAGVHATAEYADNSVKVTFAFTGIDHADVMQTLKKGTVPSLTEIEEIVSDYGVAVKDISPEIGAVNAVTTYQVICGELVGPSATISFNENGGGEVSDMTKVEGSLTGTLPTPQKTGYAFDGWFTDNGTFLHAFAEKKMPVGGAVLYAKWTANEYTVTFHVNGGNNLAADVQSKQVTFDTVYGALPQPTKSGYGFAGWFTAAEGGTEVTAETAVAVTADQTLFAHWKVLKEISPKVFNFMVFNNNGVYEEGVVHSVKFTMDSREEGYGLDGYVWKYMRQGDTEYSQPVNAGVYNITISRPADNDYAKFEHTYENVFTIAKATRLAEAFADADIQQTGNGFTYVDMKLVPGSIDDLSADTQVVFTAMKKSGGLVIPSVGGVRANARG